MMLGEINMENLWLEIAVGVIGSLAILQRFLRSGASKNEQEATAVQRIVHHNNELTEKLDKLTEKYQKQVKEIEELRAKIYYLGFLEAQLDSYRVFLEYLTQRITDLGGDINSIEILDEVRKSQEPYKPPYSTDE
jgi:flagellar biosynthesis chaperone FliJ